jgi:tRNA-splicing ligase RtcB (3'-phosphate/5'-hydroxy nucleic acid ligase)
MKKVISSERIPIKMWLDDLEDSALEQAKNLANLPFSCKHIAIMGDAHFGKGPCIGAVFVTKNTIVINGIGVDIGCSMSAYKTNLNIKDITKEDLKKTVGKIRERVPSGMGKYPEPDEVILSYLNTLEEEANVISV